MNITLILTFVAGLWIGSHIPKAWKVLKDGIGYLTTLESIRKIQQEHEQKK